MSDLITIVTGASRGIGAAIAQRFVAEGFTVVAASRTPADIDGATWAQLDVTDSAAVDELFASVSAEHGRIDVVVNNAGVQVEKTIDETDDADFDHVFDVNVRGVFHCTRAAVRAMAAQDPSGGSIINIGSVAATNADHGMALYNASKGAVQALTRAVAVDHGPDGIRCNAIAPGWIETELADLAFAQMAIDSPGDGLTAGPSYVDADDARAQAVARHPVRRLGQPDDVAALAVWLAGPESSFANGSVFTLDGGLTAQSPIGT